MLLVDPRSTEVRYFAPCADLWPQEAKQQCRGDTLVPRQPSIRASALLFDCVTSAMQISPTANGRFKDLIRSWLVNYNITARVLACGRSKARAAIRKRHDVQES